MMFERRPYVFAVHAAVFWVLGLYRCHHPPAHVHLLGPGFKVSIEVATLKTRGRADARLVVRSINIVT